MLINNFFYLSSCPPNENSGYAFIKIRREPGFTSTDGATQTAKATLELTFLFQKIINILKKLRAQDRI